MKNAYDTSTLSDSKLISTLKSFIQEERKLTTKILHYLQEVESRKLYLEAGYSSLFTYAIKELGYSSDAAYRRISAMRLLKVLPQQELESKLESGELSLTTMAQASQFFKAENSTRKQAAAPLLSAEDKNEILNELSFKSKKDVERILEEKSINKNESKVELKISLTREQYEKIQKLKALLSHKNTNGSIDGLLEILMNDGLSKYDPEEKQKRVNKNNTPLPCLGKVDVRDQTYYRHIPSRIKRAVYLRDKGQCTYRNSSTGKTCDSTHYLEYDHKIPFSLAGSHTVENLRLLCSAHHRLETEKVFGKVPPKEALLR